MKHFGNKICVVFKIIFLILQKNKGKMVKTKCATVLFAVCLFGSCSYDTPPCESVDFSREYLAGNKVSISEIEVLASSDAKQKRVVDKACSSNRIDVIVDDENDTLFYVINNVNGGWTMYSSDRRVPSIVAESLGGKYDPSKMSEAEKEWIDCMKRDMKNVKRSPDCMLNFTLSEIENNKLFWDAISNPDKVLKDDFSAKGTRSSSSLPSSGHWELFSRSTYVEPFDSVIDLVGINLDQRSPCNLYCPLKTGSTTDRVPAGCVAVAGAQMMYFLHNKLGCPQTAPSQASCYGDASSYSMNQWNFTSSVWNNMRANVAYAAPLIAWIGICVQMDYGNDGSSADTEDLVDDVFNLVGIDCEYMSFDVDVLFDNLTDSIPVIARAKRNLTKGHAFIIDSYTRERQVTRLVYEWVYDDDIIINGSSASTNANRPQVEARTEFIYFTPTIKKISMNWGWSQTRVVDKTWYTPTGDWIVVTDEGESNYDRQRHMICNFQVMD